MEPEPLFDAIAAGDAARVRELLAAGPTLAGARDGEGVSALLQARYRDAHELVGILVEAGPELDVFEAAALGAEERLDELTAREPPLVRARSADGFTPLHLAAFFAQPQCVWLLLERGADVHDVARNPMRVEPLHSAAAASQLEVVRVLLDAGADPNARQQRGAVPLHAAAQNGDEEIAELLLARGADSSVVHEDGRTAAEMARDAGHEALAARLRG